MLLDLVFQLVTSMVGAQCDFHRFILLKAAAPRPPQNEKAGQSAGCSVQRRTSGPENYFLPSCLSPDSMPSFTCFMAASTALMAATRWPPLSCLASCK